MNLRSVIRCERVLHVMRGESNFTRHLRGRKAAVMTRQGQHVLFPAMVVKVTDRMAKRGIDAHTCSKHLIVAAVLLAEPYMLTDRH